MHDLRRLASAVVLATTLLAACRGATGPQGSEGNQGGQGNPGGTGPQGCDATSAAAPLDVTFTATAPGTGFVAAGERGVLTIRVADGCGRTVSPADLGHLDLYLAGPRATTAIRTASKLLNAVTNRAALDRQHHFVNLRSPSYADPASPNLAALPDGTLVYTLAAVTDEAAGTYTAGLRVRTADGSFDRLVLAELQVGTAAFEPEAAGPFAASTCAACHHGAGPAPLQMAHARTNPTFGSENVALDQAPVAGCQLCHNLDGYSQQPAVRKVHGLHRGEHQLNPGAAHADQGLVADPTLADYSNVRFTSMPDDERDCTACHADGRWATRPSRLACGTCHDNVAFDTGTLAPPRDFGPPLGVPCGGDGDCTVFGAYASCVIASGRCERSTHPVAADGECAGCHGSAGSSPVAARHEILSRTQVPGLQLHVVDVTGASGPGGAFLVGDPATVRFTLTDATGAPVTDLKTNSLLQFTVIVGGPTDDPQRVFGPVISKGVLAYDSGTGIYSVSLGAWPAVSLVPYNSSATGTALVAGSYSTYAYVNRFLNVSGRSYRDAGGEVTTVKFGVDLPVRARQLVGTAACNGCHVALQLHGGARRQAEGCSTCHTRGAQDRGVGARGFACTMSSQCGGNAGGWETCQDTNSDAVPDTCVITSDPTPGATVDFGPMIHSIHVGRTLGGYAERDNFSPGYHLVGSSNLVADFSQRLMPIDPRNCRSCHADAGNACSSPTQCGVGQDCAGGRCTNVGWKEPSTRACLPCHDTAAAAGHAALETWSSPDGPVETCGVCHGERAAYAVDAVHALGADAILPPR
jgi:hypothetical protein